jgi:ATP-dependent Clp protease ATP-binding subunit ClpC
MTLEFSDVYSWLVVGFAVVLCVITIVYVLKRSGVQGLGQGYSSVLNQFSRDLTQLAKDGKLDPVIGRQDEIDRVVQTLCRRTKNNPVLVGKSGVGKTAIAEGLAQAIANKQVPNILLDKKVLALDLTGIVAGTKYRGEFEKRLKQIADEITASNRKIILFIDEIHTLADAGGAEGAIDADDILKPALARGDLQVIGATTANEYKEFIKKDITLDRRLHPILVDEPTAEETMEILQGIKRKYEQFHSVTISDDVIKAIVELSSKYITSKSFPDKAIDLMDESASKVSIENIKKSGDESWPEVTAEDVAEVITDWEKDSVE